jgi:hypothetical protein
VAKWLARAADQFDAVINDGTHTLVSLVDVWGQNANNKESLFTYQKTFIRAQW